MKLENIKNFIYLNLKFKKKLKMGCAFSSADETAASRKSKEIDRQLKAEFENSHKNVKLLLLGKLIYRDL